MLYVCISWNIVVFNARSIAAKLSFFKMERKRNKSQDLGRYICIVYLKISSFHARFYIVFLRIY